MDQTKYDYAFVGAGAAGLQLIVKMINDPFFKEKTILILDKDLKTENDRTWCFWEKGESLFDQFITHSWSSGEFITKQQNIGFQLEPYRYKMVRSADFYLFSKAQINENESVKWINDEVIEINDEVIVGKSTTYVAGHIFDSRVPTAFFEKQGNYHSLIQHFKGWFIKTKNPVFDPTTFRMMDYRIKWKDSTSFTYVLPTSTNSALVEFTLFNDKLIEEDVYDHYLKEYITQYLELDEYEIEEVEMGQIPMSDYPFHKYHEKHITKIGTAGGWVRPSSGYSFKNADRYSSKVIQNLKDGVKPEKGIANSRFRKYDSIFLSVLATRNDLGEDIFTRLYTKPDIHSVFRFLDEESTFAEDLKVMFSLNKPPFWKAFLTTLFK